MGHDFDDDLSHDERPVRRPRNLSSNHLKALGVWLGPSIVVGVLLFALNAWGYNTPASSGDEQRRIWGWPFMLASLFPGSQQWTICIYGIIYDSLIAIAAIAITSGVCRFAAAILDDNVNRPLPEQLRMLIRARSARPHQGATGRARKRRVNRMGR